ncbi:tyrosine-type recombinase/integrase [Tabrizicola soli]|uniref:Tyrosine-type recombinase/integrase n=1 Tax=Tabrizicola soli TaxID=2185115 RepID=A0ABV7DTD4_9RHOB|nr:site-specific integrase [Tabrizicola soli]
MSKPLHRLTVKQIEAAAPGTALADGGGLLYRATAKAAGKWSFKFVSPDADFRAGQIAKGSKSFQRAMGLGAFPAVSLAAAREKATAARDLLAKGIDPIEDDRRRDEETRQRAASIARAASEQAMTFGRYADRHFLPYALTGFTNPAHIQQWQASFATHAKALRDMPLASITREDVLRVLQPIWTEKMETASRTRQRIERLFAHAIQNGHYRGDNPASWRQFDATLPPPRVEPRHHPAVPHDQIAAFVAAVRAKQADSMAALMLEWIALAACRTGEARFATWGEIDLKRKVWAVPAERMKMKRDHIVPITQRMEETLAEAKRRHPARENGEDPAASDYVFASGKGRPLSEMAALMLMRRMEAYKDFTTHGLRSTFKDWAGEQTDFPRELIEEQLAHQLGEVERAYKRGSAYERRRPLMEAWAAVCAGEVPAGGAGNVVPLRATATGGQA